MTQLSSLIRDALGRSGARNRKRALRKLECAPWLWPNAQTRAEFDGASSPSLSTPSELIPGQVLLVGVSADLGTVDLCSLGGPCLDSSSAMAMSQIASATLDRAIIAAQRTVPLRIRPLARMPSPPSVRIWTEQLRDETTSGTPEVRTTLDGRSFGLAFYLRAASFAANVPLDPRVVALAGIGERGRLEGVGGLTPKLTAIVRCCPQIETVFVAPEQAVEADDVLRKLHARISVETAHAAAALLPAALAVDPRDAIARLSSEERRRVVSTLFQLALDGHAIVSHWAGVAQAASAAAEAWETALPSDLRGKLHFAASVASRHHSGDVRPLPPFEWTSALPQFVRHQVLAHYIQDSTDRGSDWASLLQERVASICVPATDPSPAECRVLGAWGRWRSVTGEPATALAVQQRAARQWLRLMRPEQASHPLCEWMRLAGALQDHVAAADAEAFQTEFEIAGGLTTANLRYLRLNHAVMGLRLAHDPTTRAVHLSELESLANDPTCPSHLALSAARWLLKCGSPSQRTHARSALSTGPDYLQNHRRLFAALAETQPGDEPTGLLAAMGVVTPGIAQHLKEAYAGPDLTAALLRFYLY